MKKLIFILTLLLTLKVHANTIYNIDVSIYLNQNGTASIEEIWDVKGSNGTEWYKQVYDIGNSKISNFTVSMDGNALTQKNWDINETLSQKAGYYGINETSEGYELCFGKSDYNRHTFVLKYDVSNTIFDTKDSQAFYWTFFKNSNSIDFQKYSITIRSFYDFPDDLDIWSFGHKAYYYPKDGIIHFTNTEDSDMNDGKYVAMLIKFPSGTFNKSEQISKFETFDDILKAANEGTFEYDYDNKPPLWKRILNFIKNFFWVIIMAIIGIIGAISASKNGYGYKNNRKINKKEVPNFRDIPCNKDIYYANALMFLNSFDYKETNILGAIILKWVKQEKVKFIKQETGILKKETSCLDLRGNPQFEPGDGEERLFKMMFEASEDGILEPREFGRWARSNYSSFFDVFKSFKDNEIAKLRSENHIYTRHSKEECKKKNVMDDKIYEDSTRLYGLKKFLQEFSNINTKETLEVHIWEEYLMFAYLFGIADKVAKQLKNLYPEILEQNQNMDYTTIMMINNFSTTTVNAASNARSNAENYHGGGGGFSVGGGGGGSFGGGGSWGSR